MDANRRHPCIVMILGISEWCVMCVCGVIICETNLCQYLLTLFMLYPRFPLMTRCSVHNDDTHW